MYNKNLKLYPWIKLIFSGLLFVIYDWLHISLVLFVILFIIIETCMIVLDIYMHSKQKLNVISNLGLYVLYNFIALKIIMQ